jgi:hypothetical protein
LPSRDDADEYARAEPALRRPSVTALERIARGLQGVLVFVLLVLVAVMVGMLVRTSGGGRHLRIRHPEIAIYEIAIYKVVNRSI